MHSHPYTEVIIPQNNFGKLVYNETETKCAFGNLYFISPNISHTEKGLQPVKSPEDYFCFKYISIKLNCYIYDPDKKDDLIVLKRRNSFDELNGYLFNAYKSITIYKNEELCALNLLCFYNLMVSILTGLNYKISSDTTQRYSSLTQEFEHYISRNYNIDVSIADFAKQYGVHHNTLTKKIKEETGFTPKNYLLHTRIKTSEHLLTSTDFSVSQISSMCGFASHAYFTMIFKKTHSLTPQEFRQQYLKSPHEK